MSEIVMPRLSDSMEEGTILTWMKQVGDEIAVGEEIVEIETDKANMAYEADVAGTLTEILAQEGDTLAIGSPIATIGDPAEGPAASPAGHVAGDASDASEGSERSDGERVKASPLARRLAKEKGVDIATVEGSGPAGRVVKADVEAVAAGSTSTAEAPASPAAPPSPVVSEQAETAKGTVEVVELSKLQQTVARRMAESKATAPHFNLQTEIDMTAAVEGRKHLKELAGEGDLVPTFNDMVVKACALALKEFPRANGAYRDGRFELYSRVNVGVAVAAQ
ncbi:MAG: 2-oxo acid dehydrogenase subunit E2, partial [Thermoleophilia bacterium]|nr:2-oxo acid dehydrogenase subunit E2 [Thermoleophilia bacterium]